MAAVAMLEDGLPRPCQLGNRVMAFVWWAWWAWCSLDPSIVSWLGLREGSERGDDSRPVVVRERGPLRRRSQVRSAMD